MTIQRDVTTSGDMRALEVVGIERRVQGGVTVHVVTTRG
jgi:hypothetical protein